MVGSMVGWSDDRTNFLYRSMLLVRHSLRQDLAITGNDSTSKLGRRELALCL